jgi:hypothetical protein
VALLAPVAAAQVDSVQAEDSLPPVSPVVVDTIPFQPGHILDGYLEVTDAADTEQRLRQQPTKALFKSMLIPGWGQLGNRRYFKAALFAGLDAWFIGAALHYRGQAADFRRLYEAAEPTTLRNEYHTLYDDRRTERNKYTWFAVIVTFIAMFDGYVDAHLSGFPAMASQEPVGIEMSAVDPGELVLEVRYRF